MEMSSSRWKRYKSFSSYHLMGNKLFWNVCAMMEQKVDFEARESVPIYSGTFLALELKI